MDQATELAKVKARIRLLTARTVERGCSEAEALAAAEKVGELLAVYGLSMSEVELREEACAQHRVALTTRGKGAMRWLFPALLRFCGLRGWTEGRDVLVLFGLAPDVQLGAWLLDVLVGAMAYEEAQYRASPTFAASRRTTADVLRSFRYGFAQRVAERLDAMSAAQEARAATPPPGSAGTALVLAKARKVDAALQETGVRLRTVQSQITVRDGGAYRHGMAAGGRVGLGRPVEAAPGGRLPRR